MLSKFLNLIKSHRQEIFLGICLLLVAILGYRVGRINKVPAKESANVYQNPNSKPQAPNPKQIQGTPQTAPKTDTRVVVSKNSTSKKYHFIWCPGAKRIRPENQIWFADESTAIKAGYTKAGNCN